MPPRADEAAKTTYNTLLAHLHPSPPQALEIDILPSALSRTIQYSAQDHALGVPKTILVKCFLLARSILFNHHGSTQPTLSEIREYEESGSPHRDARFRAASGYEAEDEKFAATAIILLFDPNHLTALNYRKRFLLSLSSSKKKDVAPIIEQELYFLESLLISPMRRHNKSSALFGYRLWILQRFLIPSAASRDGCYVEGGNVEEKKERWGKELEIVMVAGGKHAANYYAWDYARRVWEMLFLPGEVEEWGEDVPNRTVDTVLHWCFQHPRDVSGWSFLMWLLEKGNSVSDGCGLRTVQRVIEWKERLAWQGVALDSFLRQAQALGLFKA